MTFQEIKELDRDFLYAEEICGCLGISQPQVIRSMIKDCPNELQFSTQKLGRRYVISRPSFISWFERKEKGND